MAVVSCCSSQLSVVPSSWTVLVCRLALCKWMRSCCEGQCIGARVPFRGRHDVVVRTTQQDGLQQASAIGNLPILGNVGRAVVFEGDLEHLLVAAGEHNGTTDQHAETAPGFGPIFGGLFGETPERQGLQIVGCEGFLHAVEKGLYNRVSVLAAPCSCWLGTSTPSSSDVPSSTGALLSSLLDKEEAEEDESRERKLLLRNFLQLHTAFEFPWCLPDVIVCRCCRRRDSDRVAGSSSSAARRHHPAPSHHTARRRRRSRRPAAPSRERIQTLRIVRGWFRLRFIGVVVLDNTHCRHYFSLPL